MMQLQFPLLCRHRTPLLCYNVSHLSSFCHKTSLLHYVQCHLCLFLLCRHTSSLLCYNVNCLLWLRRHLTLLLCCNVNCFCSWCVIIERRYYDATLVAFALNVSPCDAIVMLQRQLPLLLMCRHRTPLLRCNVNCLCSCVVIEHRC